jgi:ABC-2 type transport system permease protein
VSPMKSLFLLLSPRILGFRNGLKRSDPGMKKKALVMVFTGLVFWVLMFILSSRVLLYFQSQEVIGDILAHHLLAMVLLTFFSLLVFSHIITALSNLYLSRDLELCHASPARLEELFLSRAVYTMVDSSWMVIVFGLPIMMAYAFVYRPGPGYYLSLIHLGLATAMIAAGMGILFTMILVSIFPAQRTRDIVMLLSIFGIVALYFMFRFLRPERLVDPEAFFSVMQYVSALKAPDSVYLPTHWVTEVLWGYLSGSPGRNRIFEILLTWSTAGAMAVINIWVAAAIYFTGFSKSQEAKKRRGGRKILDLFVGLCKRPLDQDLASIMEKDIRSFFRDNTQWSQLLLLGALVVVYLYNFSVLPLERSPIRLEFLQNEIAFLNMGLAGFVLSAVSVRFIFPAVSSEGGAYWIVRSSPITVKRFLWGKFTFYVFPLIVLGEGLIIITNYLLNVTPFMMVLSSITMFLVVFGIVALAVGFGALYPKFNFENIAQVATGFGGLMYMIFSALYIALIIVLEAGPVYLIFMAGVRKVPLTSLQWSIIISSFLVVLGLNALAVYKPMKMGIRALESYE